MEELVEQLRGILEDEEKRYVYADTVANAFISAQIKALREARGLSQGDLANLIGTQQSGVSRLERADYASWKIDTLRKMARAFGVRLSIRFSEFSSLPEDVSGFTQNALTPRRYADDPVFGSNPRHSLKRRIRPPRTSRHSGRVSIKPDQVSGSPLARLPNVTLPNSQGRYENAQW